MHWSDSREEQEQQLHDDFWRREVAKILVLGLESQSKEIKEGERAWRLHMLVHGARIGSLVVLDSKDKHKEHQRMVA